MPSGITAVEAGTEPDFSRKLVAGVSSFACQNTSNHEHFWDWWLHPIGNQDSNVRNKYTFQPHQPVTYLCNEAAICCGLTKFTNPSDVSCKNVSLGLPLGTEAPVMTPNGVDLSFVFLRTCCSVQCHDDPRKWT